MWSYDDSSTTRTPFLKAIYDVAGTVGMTPPHMLHALYDLHATPYYFANGVSSSTRNGRLIDALLTPWHRFWLGRIVYRNKKHPELRAAVGAMVTISGWEDIAVQVKTNDAERVDRTTAFAVEFVQGRAPRSVLREFRQWRESTDKHFKDITIF